MMRLPLRLRVTLASAVSTALILGALSLFVYVGLRAELLRAADGGLQASAEGLASAIGQHRASLTDAPDTGPASVTQILTPEGRVRMSVGSPAPRLSAAALRAIHGPTFVQLPGAAGQPAVRAFVLPTNEGRQLFVVVGSTMAGVHQTIARLRLLLVVADPTALALACLAAWFLTGAALRPVEEMRQEAAAISMSEPGRRLPVPAANDEVARLGKTLNLLLDRLQSALDRERRLLDDASHELRTPLSILKAELDLALSRKRTPMELEAALKSASEETDRLAVLAEDLLALSRAHDGGLRIHRVSTSLRELLQQARAGRLARAAEDGVRIEYQAPALSVMVDPLRLRQALDNLLDNAIRYSPAGGLIRIEASVTTELATITMHNSGPGFPADILPQAFDAFVRDEREISSQHGAGLGLTIVRAVAEAHGGAAAAENVPGGAVLTMTLAFPLDPAPGPPAARP